MSSKFYVSIAVVIGSAVVFFKLRKKLSHPKLKLKYFDIAGKAEGIRLLCKHSSIPIVDIRMTSDEFKSIKHDGSLLFEQLPALEVVGQGMIVQSAAIVRYLGKIRGLYPRCPLKASLVDAIIDEENDLYSGLLVSKYSERLGFKVLLSHPELVAEIRKDLNDTIIPKHLRFIDRILYYSNSGWIANTPQPTIADFVMAPRLKQLSSGGFDGISKDILVPFSNILNFLDKFYKLPAVVEYYKIN